jgi:hypothetical protein
MGQNRNLRKNMTTHSLAQEVIYEFFQDTEENTLHLSVHTKVERNSEVISMQFNVTDAIRMFASLASILPRMENLCKEPLGQEFVRAIVEDQPIKEICGVVPFYFTSNKLPEIKAGDLVAVGDTVIGRALSPTEADGTVNIAIDSIVYGSALKEQPIQMTVRVNARDLVVIHE